jgi:hypothetical protein
MATFRLASAIVRCLAAFFAGWDESIAAPNNKWGKEIRIVGVARMRNLRSIGSHFIQRLFLFFRGRSQGRYPRRAGRKNPSRT